MWTAIGSRQIALVSRPPQMVLAVGKPWHRGVAAKLRRGRVYVAERPAAFAVISSSSEQRRIPAATIVGVELGRVCTGFPRDVFPRRPATNCGGAAALSFRIPTRASGSTASRFARLMRSARPGSREIFSVVQGIIVNLASSP